MDDLIKKQAQALMDAYKLTNKQALFCIFYRGNATHAAQQAGYAGNKQALAVMGSKLVKLAKVRDAIDSIKERAGSTDPLTAEQIITTFSMFARDATVPVKDRMKALEQVGKLMGLYIDKVALKAQVEHLDRLTDSELVDMLGQHVGTLVDLGVIKQIDDVAAV